MTDRIKALAAKAIFDYTGEPAGPTDWRPDYADGRPGLGTIIEDCIAAAIAEAARCPCGTVAENTRCLGCQALLVERAVIEAMKARDQLRAAESSSAAEAASILLKALGWSSGGLGAAAAELVNQREAALESRQIAIDRAEQAEAAAAALREQVDKAEGQVAWLKGELDGLRKGVPPVDAQLLAVMTARAEKAEQESRDLKKAVHRDRLNANHEHACRKKAEQERDAAREVLREIRERRKECRMPCVSCLASYDVPCKPSCRLAAALSDTPAAETPTTKEQTMSSKCEQDVLRAFRHIPKECPALHAMIGNPEPKVDHLRACVLELARWVSKQAMSSPPEIPDNSAETPTTEMTMDKPSDIRSALKAMVDSRESAQDLGWYGRPNRPLGKADDIHIRDDAAAYVAAKELVEATGGEPASVRPTAELEAAKATQAPLPVTTEDEILDSLKMFTKDLEEAGGDITKLPPSYNVETSRKLGDEVKQYAEMAAELAKDPRKARSRWARTALKKAPAIAALLETERPHADHLRACIMEMARVVFPTPADAPLAEPPPPVSPDPNRGRVVWEAMRHPLTAHAAAAKGREA